MSDEGDKTCPLCAEEMDLTDLQLKPCKCGYEICVWCWHHIMDMAEKDETQGRCPACRTPYNKEKIVGTAVKCGKLVTELNVEKKLKSQKGKGKTLDVRKQLESVRVIQRNLVYVVGLPLNYADEGILLRKDYFSQYGKVLKVSISRTTGAIQQFANNTCSVYITYSKEEEAVRCIQSVHGFVLDGKSLRACFGTTKYCHAWLRNVPCNNKDCLYLHEIGSQEDSYTKDEIISAYTRNRVEQITGSSNITQQRAGNVLPPPGDEYCNNSSTSGKPITKAFINTNQNVTSVARVSPPNSSSGKSALPAGASWGTRPANTSQPSSSTAYFNAPPNQKHDISNGPVAISKKSSSTSQESSLQSDVGKKKVQNQENIMTREKIKNTSGLKEKNSNANCGIHISNGPVASVDPVNFPSSRQPSSPSKTKLPPDFSNIFDCSVFSTGPLPDNKSISNTDGSIKNVCSSILSMSIHENQPALNGYVEPNKDPLIRQMSAKVAKTIDDRCGAHVQSEFGHGMQSNLTQVDWHEREDDVLFIDNQRVNDPQVATSIVQEFTDVMNLSKHFSTNSHELSNAGRSIGIAFDRQVVDRNVKFLVPTLNLPDELSENLLINFEGNDAGHSNLFQSNERRYLLGRYEGEASSSGVDMGESNIISNILSMDIEPWNESFSTSQNLAKLLWETDKRERSFGVSGPWKNHNSNQSRFSFARDGEIMNQSGQSNGYVEQGFKQHPFGHDISSRDSLDLGRSESRNGLPVFGGTGSDNFASSSHSHIPSNKPYASKSHISNPPGFSVPNRAPPPPGFASPERTEPFFEPISGNHMHDASSSLLRNPYQTPLNTNAFNNGDIDFMDPAILAVGKGTLPAGGINNPGLDMKSNFPLQLNMYEDSRFQSLLQRSLLPHQNQRVNNDLGDCFSTLVDAYGLPSRIADQTLSNNQLPFSQFNLSLPRNGISPNGSNSRMVDLLRNERLGLNKSYGGYEESDIQNPSSGNLYHRTYGI